MSERSCAHCGKPIPRVKRRSYVKVYCGHACFGASRRVDPATRFLTFCAPGANGCTVFTGTKTRFGYGMFDNGLAHRFAWQQAKGPIPNGLCVLHRCDNPSCVNPDHLFLGTKADNNHDKIAKGRHRHISGSTVKTARLKEHEVRAILRDSRSYSEIGATYNVCHATISHIKNGRNWKALHAEFARLSTDEKMKEAMEQAHG